MSEHGSKANCPGFEPNSRHSWDSAWKPVPRVDQSHVGNLVDGNCSEAHRWLKASSILPRDREWDWLRSGLVVRFTPAKEQHATNRKVWLQWVGVGDCTINKILCPGCIHSEDSLAWFQWMRISSISSGQPFWNYLNNKKTLLGFHSNWPKNKANFDVFGGL